MDSWKYLSEGKGLWLSEELDFPADGHGSCKNKMMGCDIKPLFNVENYPLVSNTQALEKLDFMDLGFSDEIRKSYSISSEPSGEVFSDEIGTDSYGNVESGSRISNGFLQSNNQDFPLIDLKLGRLPDGGVAKDGDFSKAKRARLTTLYHRPPCCQVLGCNKDLSSCKGYYKRHKVCDVHTKTAKVIVDGIEQRFCQQCSRFHLLAEFDDGKRSCRRRLAAHNKRRRKPQLTSESGARIIGFSSSFGFPETLPTAVVDSVEEMGNAMAFADVKDNIFGFQKSSGVQQTSTRARSLLSAQSHNMSSQLLGAEHVEHTTLNRYDDHTVDLTIPVDGLSRGPDLRNNSNYHNPLGRGIILDLLQLSSHLQRIEQQRHSTESEAG